MVCVARYQADVDDIAEEKLIQCQAATHRDGHRQDSEAAATAVAADVADPGVLSAYLLLSRKYSVVGAPALLSTYWSPMPV